MKRILAFAAAFLLVAGIASSNGNSAAVTFNLTATMIPYIEATPGPLAWNLGSTNYSSSYGPPRLNLYVTSGVYDLFYANCPFVCQLSGQNGAGENFPRFARLEEGPNANGWDTLPTIYYVRLKTNNIWTEVTDWFDGSGIFPRTKNFTEAPHNGQVAFQMTVGVNDTTTPDTIPTREVRINPAFTWQQSADAGVYTCDFTITLTAL